MSSNFRSHFIWLFLLVGVAIFRIATAKASISYGDAISLKDRIIQMERIAKAHSELLTQLQQQITETQHDIDYLRGQIQENKHMLNQVIERQKQIYHQINHLGSSSLIPSESHQFLNQQPIKLLPPSVPPLIDLGR